MAALTCTRSLVGGVVVATLTALGTTASAAIITDPALSGPGADTFDPAGNESVDPGADHAPLASQATLEARPDIRSIQDFTGFAVGQNTFSFTNPLTPDIQFRLSGSAGGNAGRSAPQADRNTSGGGAYTLDATDATAPAVFTIDFGAYDSLTGTFVSAANPVAAAGFTLSGGLTLNFTVEFQTDAGVVLSSTNFQGQLEDSQPSGVAEFFVGFDNGLVPAIGQIVISRTGSTFDSNLDDLGFTVIPEPTSLAAASAGLLCLLGRRRRA